MSSTERAQTANREPRTAAFGDEHVRSGERHSLHGLRNQSLRDGAATAPEDERTAITKHARNRSAVRRHRADEARADVPGREPHRPTVVVGERRFEVHGCVLMCGSEFFRTQLQTGVGLGSMRELTLPAMSARAFELIVEWACSVRSTPRTRWSCSRQASGCRSGLPRRSAANGWRSTSTLRRRWCGKARGGSAARWFRQRRGRCWGGIHKKWRGKRRSLLCRSRCWSSS